MLAAARVGDPIAHQEISVSSMILAILFSGWTPATDPEDMGRMLAESMPRRPPGKSGGQLTHGSPNVYVNAMPATMVALAAGNCKDHSGLRTVATGVAGVLINTKPAARVSEKMDCGGVIVAGSPDVFIGGNAAPPICVVLRGDAAKIAQFLIEAQAAQAVYQPPESRTPPDGYRNATDEDLRKLRLDQSMFEHPIDPATGEPSEFRAGAFINEQTGAPLIAFKGTTPTSWSDWKQNLVQGAGGDSFYYNQAQNIARRASGSAAGADTRFVGHSLGGGMASAAARATGRPATTFNAAGLNAKTVPQPLPSEIDAVYVKGEALRASQAIPGMPKSAETRAWPLDPDAPPASEGMLDAFLDYGPLGVGGHLGGRAVALHGMEAVVPALVKKQKEIAEEMAKNGCG
jgi:uncharacterized Zn-binding protein involved in type VI secretion